jgi:hypothetical protein
MTNIIRKLNMFYKRNGILYNSQIYLHNNPLCKYTRENLFYFYLNILKYTHFNISYIKGCNRVLFIFFQLINKLFRICIFINSWIEFN